MFRVYFCHSSHIKEKRKYKDGLLFHPKFLLFFNRFFESELTTNPFLSQTFVGLPFRNVEVEEEHAIQHTPTLPSLCKWHEKQINFKKKDWTWFRSQFTGTWLTHLFLVLLTPDIPLSTLMSVKQNTISLPCFLYTSLGFSKKIIRLEVYIPLLSTVWPRFTRNFVIYGFFFQFHITVLCSSYTTY